MKCSLTAFVGAISVIAVAYPASANEKNTPLFPNSPGQAAILTTEPVTMDGLTDNANRSGNLRNIADSIPAVRPDKRCSMSDPFELIKNPSETFKQCQEKQQNSPEQPENSNTAAESLYRLFSPPALNSGMKIQVTQF